MSLASIPFDHLAFLIEKIYSFDEDAKSTLRAQAILTSEAERDDLLHKLECHHPGINSRLEQTWSFLGKHTLNLFRLPGLRDHSQRTLAVCAMSR